MEHFYKLRQANDVKSSTEGTMNSDIFRCQILKYCKTSTSLGNAMENEIAFYAPDTSRLCDFDF